MERPRTIAADYGEMCLPTQFCTIGVAAGTNCPEGTYSDARGLAADTECHDCPEGYICTQTGTASTSGIADVPVANTATIQACPATFFCPLGTDDIAGTGVQKQDCTAGNMCVSGAIAPVPCVAGEYNGSPNQDSCSTCTAGNFCPFMYDVTSPPSFIAGTTGTSQLTPCTAGHQCDAGSMDAPKPCAAGFF